MQLKLENKYELEIFGCSPIFSPARPHFLVFLLLWSSKDSLELDH